MTLQSEEGSFFDAQDEWEDTLLPESKKTFNLLASETRLQAILVRCKQQLAATRSDYKTQQSIIGTIINTTEQIHRLRDLISDTRFFYKLAIQITVELDRFFDSTEHRRFKILVSVPDLFFLPTKLPLFLDGGSWHYATLSPQISENRGRHALRVFFSPKKAYELGTLHKSEYWAKHFRASRASLLRCLVEYILADTQQVSPASKLSQK